MGIIDSHRTPPNPGMASAVSGMDPAIIITAFKRNAEYWPDTDIKITEYPAQLNVAPSANPIPMIA